MDMCAAIHQWQALLGISKVLLGDAASDAYGHDTSAATRLIPVALQLENGTFLQQVMRIASQNKVPVYPISTGNNWGYGTALPVRDGCVIIDLSRLDRIVHFDEELGVITLEPGVTQGMLADFLDAGNFPFLVPVTGAGPNCSLVGNALERGYGVTPHIDHFGAVTDLEAVLPDGSLYRSALREAGGEDLARLFKWGIGPYFSGLFTQGGFGIVTRMSFVLARRPECVKVCFFGLPDEDLLEPCIKAVHTLLGRFPAVIGAMNLMNRRRILSMTAPFPLDKLGPDGMIPGSVLDLLGRQYQVMPWTGFVTLYGTKPVVEAVQKEIRNTLSQTAKRLIFLTPDRANTLARLSKWIPGDIGKRLARMTDTLAKSLELVAGRPNETALPLVYWRNPNGAPSSPKNPAQDGCGLTWYAPLVPMRSVTVRHYVNMIENILPKYGIEPLITLTSMNDRLFDSTVPLIFNPQNSSEVAASEACYAELITVGRGQGFFPYRVGVNHMQTLVNMQKDSKTFQARLRKDLDPHDILSPGRYR